MPAPTSDQIRARFPALASGYVFMDNAGGSQVPGAVADAVRDYMTRCYVQVGADYPASREATQTVAEAHAFIETLMGGQDAGRAILGPSTTALFRMLANAYADVWQPGDEIVVAENSHEAGIAPWVALEKRGMKVRWWLADPDTGACPLEALNELLNDRTKLVALPHTSNILGGVEDIAGAVRAARRVGAKVVADGVAYAPHRLMDVAPWGVDWYAFSTYKVFGPHMAALWGSREAQAELEGPNHFFISKQDIPYKFELGGVLHEGCAGMLALRDYFAFLADLPEFSRAAVETGYARIAALERPMTESILDLLRSCPGVRIAGIAQAGEGRLPTVSFTHRTVSSKAIADEAAKHGIRHGHYYAYRLLQRMGIEPEDGVARVSLAHTNTAEEVAKLVRVLDPVLNA
jgi:cysteine desulfurase family protein (TIGR01976 family)